MQGNKQGGHSSSQSGGVTAFSTLFERLSHCPGQSRRLAWHLVDLRCIVSQVGVLSDEVLVCFEVHSIYLHKTTCLPLAQQAAQSTHNMYLSWSKAIKQKLMIGFTHNMDVSRSEAVKQKLMVAFWHKHLYYTQRCHDPCGKGAEAFEKGLF